MLTRFVPGVLVALVPVVLLTACTASAYLLVSPSEIATTAENALEQQVGSRPAIDCGTDDVTLVNGTKVDCILTDPATGEKFEALVTISGVDGANYSVSVNVGDEAIK